MKNISVQIALIQAMLPGQVVKPATEWAWQKAEEVDAITYVATFWVK